MYRARTLKAKGSPIYYWLLARGVSFFSFWGTITAVRESVSLSRINFLFLKLTSLFNVDYPAGGSARSYGEVNSLSLWSISKWLLLCYGTVINLLDPVRRQRKALPVFCHQHRHHFFYLFRKFKLFKIWGLGVAVVWSKGNILGKPRLTFKSPLDYFSNIFVHEEKKKREQLFIAWP